MCDERIYIYNLIGLYTRVCYVFGFVCTTTAHDTNLLYTNFPSVVAAITHAASTHSRIIQYMCIFEEIHSLKFHRHNVVVVVFG